MPDLSPAPLFDTHAHLQDEAFAEDLPQLLEDLRLQGVARVVLPGSGLDDSARACELALAYPGLYAVIGVHPHEASSWNEASRERLIELYRRTEAEGRERGRERVVVGIGEIGLDYHYDFSPRAQQAAVYRAQLEIAAELGLPVVIHEREAFADSYEMIRKAHKDGLFVRPAACHCFSGSVESARLLSEFDFYFGFDGPITFKNARKSLEVLQSIPRERILLETDSPYLTPVPHRGRRNDPGKLPLIEAKAAEILGLTPEEMRRLNWENACRFFGL